MTYFVVYHSQPHKHITEYSKTRLSVRNAFRLIFFIWICIIRVLIALLSNIWSFVHFCNWLIWTMILNLSADNAWRYIIYYCSQLSAVILLNVIFHIFKQSCLQCLIVSHSYLIQRCWKIFSFSQHFFAA